jgi:hypothetical protein
MLSRAKHLERWFAAVRTSGGETAIEILHFVQDDNGSFRMTSISLRMKFSRSDDALPDAAQRLPGP